MLLGKRRRPPIRTKSITGITDDFATMEESGPSNTSAATETITAVHQNPTITVNPYVDEMYYQRKIMPMETTHFLRTCGLCMRQLDSGRDIYMYRGESGFCSLECREKKMKQDERKEKKYGGVSSKKQAHGY